MVEKTALITGGSRGLGREIATALGNLGYKVAVNYLNNKDEAEKVVRLVGGDAFSIKADVGDYGQVEEMARTIEQKWGKLDALINNAGIARDALLVKATGRDWDDVMGVNLKGCFNTVKAFAPLMKNAGGHIVNISSYSGLRGKRGQAAYSASKAAVIGFTNSVSSELGRYNIRVNAVLPGYMRTYMGETASDAMEAAREESLIGRLSEPGEVAGFVGWLIGTECVAGQVFVLDSRGHINSRQFD